MTSHAFMTTNVQLAKTQEGDLSATTFAVKDVFAVKGYTNSAGNPTWLATHTPSTQTAPTIEALLAQGATCKGMAITDELMYSLNGENMHYGTPSNPYDHERIPGGSSSGSAAAVAWEEVDFALGTDTGGSVRIPSAYCGLYGIRPTYQAVTLEGVIPLAKSFDTVGWMTRSAHLLQQVGDVLLPKNTTNQTFDRIVYETQAWSYVSEEHGVLLEDVVQKAGLPTTATTLQTSLTECAQLFRYIQGIEIWQQHGAWIETAEPQFAQAIAERFLWTKTLDASMYDELKYQQQLFTQQLSQLLGQRTLLAIPTTPSVAPLKGANGEVLERVRTQTMELSCIAGLSGFPQVTIPVENAQGLPIAVSFIANRGADRALLQFVAKLGGVFV